MKHSSYVQIWHMEQKMKKKKDCNWLTADMAIILGTRCFSIQCNTYKAVCNIKLPETDLKLRKEIIWTSGVHFA